MYSNETISTPIKQEIENQTPGCSQNMLSGTFQSPSKSSNKRSSNVFDSSTSNYETNDLVLELKWSERDLVNLHLNQLSASLFSTNTPEYKNSLIQTNNEIIIRLGDLRLSELNLKSSKFEIDQRKRMKSSSPFEPTLELDWNVRMKLMDHLILNKNLTILRSDSINGKTKHQLYKANNSWIHTLQTLPVGITIDEEENDDASKSNENQSTENQSTDNMMDKLMNSVNSHIINNLKQENRQIFGLNSTSTVARDNETGQQDTLTANNTPISNVSSSMGDQLTHSQLNGLNQSMNSEKLNVSRQLDELEDQNQTEAEFTVKITNFEYFLTTNKRVYSSTFYLKGMPFNLSLRNKELKQTNKVYKYMDFSLHCLQNGPKDLRENVYFELRCLSQKADTPNIVKKFDFVFTHTALTYQSLNYFSYNSILDHLKKNHVVNNQIYFQCYCKCKNEVDF